MCLDVSWSRRLATTFGATKLTHSNHRRHCAIRAANARRVDLIFGLQRVAPGESLRGAKIIQFAPLRAQKIERADEQARALDAGRVSAFGASCRPHKFKRRRRRQHTHTQSQNYDDERPASSLWPPRSDCKCACCAHQSQVRRVFENEIGKRSAGKVSARRKRLLHLCECATAREDASSDRRHVIRMIESVRLARGASLRA